MVLHDRSGAQLGIRYAPKSWNGSTWVTKSNSFVGRGAEFTWDNLPPNCEMRFEGRGDHYINGSWVNDTAYSARGLITGPISTSQSVAAKSYNTGQLKVKVLKHRSNAIYKVYAQILASNITVNGSWGAWSPAEAEWAKATKKTFTLNGSSSTASSFEQTFEITGLQQDTLYAVRYSIYQVYNGKEYLGASNVSAGQFKTPAMSSYLSVPAVTDVQIEGTSHTAKVYWNVTAVKSNSYYKLFYIDEDGHAKDTGIQTTAAPSQGYTEVTVAEVDLTESREVTFFVRAYSTQVPATQFNESNRLSAMMYTRFAWTVPKIQGGAAIVTAEEWNRCKQFTGVVNSSFKETEVYENITLPGDTVTNEEIQAVCDALGLERTIDDGDVITAELYNAIETAINS